MYKKVLLSVTLTVASVVFSNVSLASVAAFLKPTTAVVDVRDDVVLYTEPSDVMFNTVEVFNDVDRYEPYHDPSPNWEPLTTVLNRNEAVKLNLNFERWRF